jgi:hypothetical protein
VWRFLKHASFWQLVSIGLLLWSLLLLYQRNDARHDRDSYRSQRDYWKGEVVRITSARDRQRSVTEKNVRVVEQGPERVRTVIKEIHDAPNPEGCRTPALDELRRVL